MKILTVTYVSAQRLLLSDRVTKKCVLVQCFGV